MSLNTPNSSSPSTDTEPSELPTLSPDELKDTYCRVCAGTFDLSSSGVFPEHYFNFRSLRKLCGASRKRYAYVKGNAKRGSELNDVQQQSTIPSGDGRKPKRRTITLLEDGRAECPVCRRRMSPNKKNQTLPLHKTNGKACPASNGTFDFLPGNPSTKSSAKPQYDIQKYLDKYRVRSPEELRKEREKEERKKHKSKKRTKLTATQRAARARQREEARERRRHQRLSDSYALDCHDSWGQDDHSVDQGVSVRTYRGGLPGQGKRR